MYNVVNINTGIKKKGKKVIYGFFSELNVKPSKK